MVTILTDSNQVCNPKSKVMVKDDGDDIKLFLLMQPAAYILRTTFRHCLSKYLKEKVPINLMLFLLRLNIEIVEVLK